MDTKGFELGRDGPSVLVVGIDGSDTSWRAMYYAFGLARRQSSTVLAVFAATTPMAFDGTLICYQEGEDPAGDLEAAVEALADEYQVTTRFLCVRGDPVLILSHIAAEHCADAIIIGASQALAHRLFGSKATRAVRRCQCPVTVVP
jgi:nucleotide-binding universal stress UspA family protein